MEKLREDLDTVKKILAGAPRGMTILGVSEQMGVNRNAVAKYLEVLRVSGEVDLKMFGRAKIFSLSNRVPLATALSLSSDLIVLIDNDLQVIDTNDKFLQFTGLNRSQIVGCSLERVNTDILAHPGILLNIKDALNGKEYSQEISVQRGEDYNYFKIKLLPVTTNDLQRRVAVIYENITARKKAEIALKESEARYRAVVEDQTEFICRLLPDSTITFANDAWCRFFRCKREYVPGKELIDMADPAYCVAFMKDIERIRMNRPSLTVERQIMFPDGVRWIQQTYRGRFDNRGKLSEIQIVARDITERIQAEEMLRKMFRAVEGSPAIVIITGVNGNIEYVNPRFIEVTGYNYNEVYGKNPRILRSGHTTQEEYKQLWDTVLSGKQWHGEFLNRKKNGELFWESAMISPITDSNGIITSFIAIKEDITDRRRAENALKENEEKLRALFDQSPICVATASLDFRFLRINTEFSRITGYPEAELFGKTFLELTHPDDREKDLSMALEMISGHIERYCVEKRYVCKDGSVKWLRKNARLVKEPDGKPMYLLSMFEDITEKRQMEESLKMTQFSVDNASDEVMWVGPDGRLVYANKAMCSKLGFSKESLLSMHVWDINPMCSPEKFPAMLNSVRKHGHREFESAHRTRDGAVYPIDVTAIYLPLKDGDCLCAYSRDISERKKAEITLRENEENFRALFDQSPIGACMVSLDNRFLKVNPEICHITGYSETELLAMGFPEITFAEDLEKDLAMVRELVAGRVDRYSIEKRCVRKDGRIIWLRKHVRLVRDSDGQPLYFLPMIEDITDKKKLDDSLKLTQFTMDNAIEGIMWGDHEGRCQYVNDTICRMLRYTRDELMGMWIWDINPVYNIETWGMKYAESKEKGVLQYETAHRAKDGTMIPVEILVNYIKYNGSEYYCAFIRDITSRKKAEHELKMYQYTIDNTKEAICWIGADGSIVQVNKAACQKSGYTREELLSVKIFQFCPKFNDEAWQSLWERKNNIDGYKLETIGRMKTGDLLQIKVTLSRVAFDDREYLCLLIQDMADVKSPAANLNRP